MKYIGYFVLLLRDASIWLVKPLKKTPQGDLYEYFACAN